MEMKRNELLQTAEKISIPHDSFELSGLLFKPAVMQPDKKYPALVVVHPAGGVKEQTAGMYAKKMADKNFVTVAYDASHQGESGGEPRYLEDPKARVEDIHFVVAYLKSLPFVDGNKIGVLGVCAGGGYAVQAAKENSDVKALVTISAVDVGRSLRDPVKQNSLADIVTGLRQMAKQPKGEKGYTTYVPTSKEGFTKLTPEYAKEAYEYYRTPRGSHPRAENKMLSGSISKMALFNSLRGVNKILTVPLLMIVGSEADTAYMSEDIVKKAGSVNKELFQIDGATHVSLYDNEEQSNLAVNKICSFLSTAFQ